MLFEKFLYLAIFQNDSNLTLPVNIIYNHDIYVYIDKWGQKGDYGLVALVGNRIVGIAWSRILNGDIKGYGNLDDKTTEFAILILKDYRKQGIGKKLLKQLLDDLKMKGYQKISLSVDKANYAVG